MKFIFNEYFISNNEIVFYTFIVIMILIIIYAAYFTYKEIVKNETR